MPIASLRTVGADEGDVRSWTWDGAFDGDNYRVYGRSSTAGKVHDYFEVWDRIS